MHNTTAILMVRPVNFGFNPQTAASNAFQQQDGAQQQVQANALNEFDKLVNLLRSNGVHVIVVDDTAEPHTPDSIFPNNWVSFHQNGDIFLYPMQAENRRLERREDIISRLEDQFKVRHIIDLSRFELQNKFLEGTGSMVLDRENKIAYACRSPRTNMEVLNMFCEESGYSALTFQATDEKGLAIYHTNVMMCIGGKYAVICMDSISSQAERQAVIASLGQTGKTIVGISFQQMQQFAGNMLEVQNDTGERLLVMSGSAYRSLSDVQINTLQKFCRLIYADIPTIERNGGGSVRCMLAEVALPALRVEE